MTQIINQSIEAQEDGMTTARVVIGDDDLRFAPARRDGLAA